MPTEFSKSNREIKSQCCRGGIQIPLHSTTSSTSLLIIYMKLIYNLKGIKITYKFINIKYYTYY